MIENIKSAYFIKHLFSYIHDGITLALAKYNKKLQNILNIGLFNYKIFSGKYIKYEGKGRVEIYNAFDDRIIYEGEFLNGKKHGKGKEYNKYGVVMFKGEYINGKRIIEGNTGLDEFNEGYVYQYNVYKELIYEGEFLNWKRHGKGKEYYDYGQLKFEGEYFYGKKWNGIEYVYKEDKDNIINEYKNGKGYIIEEEENDHGQRVYFEGEYLNGERNGKGKVYYDFGELIFEGEYLNGKRNGKGKEYDDGKLVFEGEYLYGNKIKGRAYVKGKLEYEGDYLYNRKWDGKGFDINGNILYELLYLLSLVWRIRI